MNVEEQLEHHEKENIELKAKVQLLETQLGEEKKIHDQNIASLEEKYQNEIAELKGKLSEQNEVFEEKLKKLEEMVQTNKQKISETENEIHQMKVLLPLENWHDLLAFVPRSQLGNAVSEIGDYQFASIIQSFLHDEVRKIILGEMRIISPRRYIPSDKPMVHVMPNAPTNIPDWPMPGNIKNFKGITLDYLHTSILNFLEDFQQNSLLTNVNMQFHYNSNANVLLPKILPLISSIDSIECFGGIDLFELAYNNTNDGISHESQLLLKEMMEKTRILLTHWTNWRMFGTWEDRMDWICSWLYTPRNDGKPRMMRLYIYAIDTNNEYASFIEHIKKDFNEANHAVSFFFCSFIYQYDNVEDISIDNFKTNEKLVIKITNRGDQEGMLIIWRYPVKATKNWIEANEKEIIEWDGEKLDRKMNLTYI